MQAFWQLAKGATTRRSLEFDATCSPAALSGGAWLQVVDHCVHVYMHPMIPQRNYAVPLRNPRYRVLAQMRAACQLPGSTVLQTSEREKTNTAWKHEFVRACSRIFDPAVINIVLAAHAGDIGDAHDASSSVPREASVTLRLDAGRARDLLPDLPGPAGVCRRD